MKGEVSTSVYLPEEVFRSVKLRAAREGKTIKQIVLEGLKLLLGTQPFSKRKKPRKNTLLEFSGSVESNIRDGSVHHDKYIYGK